jgi:hypothetical protein
MGAIDFLKYQEDPQQTLISMGICLKLLRGKVAWPKSKKCNKGKIAKGAYGEANPDYVKQIRLAASTTRVIY